MTERRKRIYQMDWAGRRLRVEVGEVAQQADGAALVYYGDTVVLSTATASKEPKGDSFFPLTVNYDERSYAVGKIPGGFIRREGRPSNEATLSARLIDRSIRPLFPDGFRNEVQVDNIVLSYDPDCSAQMAAMLGSSLALSLSPLPFGGPIAGARVGRVGGELVINPTAEQEQKSDLHLTVAGTWQAVDMVEAGAKEVAETAILDAIFFAHEEVRKLIAFERKIMATSGKPKIRPVLSGPDEALEERVRVLAADRLNQAVHIKGKQQRDRAARAVRLSVLKKLAAEDPSAAEQVEAALSHLLKTTVRRMVIGEHIRPDGRRADEIRPLAARTGLLPRVHGSGLFTRGQTQALSVCTLGPLSDAQTMDDFSPQASKHFIYHYNFPGFSTGEIRSSRTPGRREIGHGALGERALAPVIPDTGTFPYTIRCVSEVLESNGSSSQASICGSTLALMDAGVPIKAPVAGIAMGLMKSGDEQVILSDIQGMEDALGDMDFKCAGTEKGITALQLDIKTDGVDRDVLAQALNQARAGRLQILAVMRAALPAPRPHLSAYAPKILRMSINPAKIRDVIGSNGKVINHIIETTGVKIDIHQDGNLTIFYVDEAGGRQARRMIEEAAREVRVGEIYNGTVKRIEKFGVFVTLFGHTDGLVHLTELSERPVTHAEDIADVGDSMRVQVIDVDRQGRIKLSRKALLHSGESIGS